MNIFNWRSKTITLDDQKSVLMGRRDPATLRRFPELTHPCSPELTQAF
jgi:hypothetical protein